MIFRYKIKFISDIEQKIRKLLVNIAVTPFVGVWIEIITYSMESKRLPCVTPFVGVWIEIFFKEYSFFNEFASLPSWECGLKYRCSFEFVGDKSSLPSWECGLKYLESYLKDVYEPSLPSWECGLKYTL